MPDIPSGKLRTLIADLHDLHLRAGLPGVRAIAKGTGFSHTAVYDLMTSEHRRPPNIQLVHAVSARLASMARGVDADETADWIDKAWREAAKSPFDADADVGLQQQEPSDEVEPEMPPADPATQASMETGSETPDSHDRHSSESTDLSSDGGDVASGVAGETESGDPLAALFAALQQRLRFAAGDIPSKSFVRQKPNGLWHISFARATFWVDDGSIFRLLDDMPFATIAVKRRYKGARHELYVYERSGYSVRPHSFDRIEARGGDYWKSVTVEGDLTKFERAVLNEIALGRSTEDIEADPSIDTSLPIPPGIAFVDGIKKRVLRIFGRHDIFEAVQDARIVGLIPEQIGRSDPDWITP
jgi:hypothetical protein